MSPRDVGAFYFRIYLVVELAKTWIRHLVQ